MTLLARSRTLVIGDIHGHCRALQSLLAALELRPDDSLVFLGDYVDRGPDSRGVLELILHLQSQYRVVSLMGNHEAAMLDARERDSAREFWLSPACGGRETLASYGGADDLSGIPARHWRFLERLPLVHETETHFFVHANYAANWPLDQHDSRTALWLDLRDLPGPHYSGKIAIVGHTPQLDGSLLDAGHLLCLDTGCGLGGWLTAFDVESGDAWQVDEQGRVREESSR